MLQPLGFGIVVDQSITTLSKAAFRNLRLNFIDSCTEESCPIVRLDCIQRLNDIVEGIGNRDIATVIDSEEELGEIIQRLLSIADLDRKSVV